ncbi:MAG: serine/threonine protein phosphatase [Oscillospiraceae bacterium]|nr:serine/threonine protein phosphatase [Oscillospiraceae bacterium]
MIYVTSDLHGCSPDAFRALLEQAGFSDDDTLYVLGDVIDRGAHGVPLLVWLLNQPNVHMLLGNHEAMLLNLTFLFYNVTGETEPYLNRRQTVLLDNWLYNGGRPTLQGLQQLQREDPALLESILDKIRNLPLYATVEAGGKQFILVHAGLGNFSEEKPLSDYTLQELLWVRPTPDTQYYQDKKVIFGHTPTLFYGNEYVDRALSTPTWTCIDTGAAGGRMPMLLRLEDETPFYAPLPPRKA